MKASTEWQLTRESANRYEDIIVPTVLGPAGRLLVEWSDFQKGGTVVDIGCGTGAVTRLLAPIMGPSGRVIGIDVNPGMLEVAQSLPHMKGAEIEWRLFSAYDTNLPDNTAETVFCAQTLQFLKDRPLALREMKRILKGGGRLFMSLWSEVNENPYFRALVDAISVHVNEETALSFHAASSLSDTAEIQSLLEESGFSSIEIVTRKFFLNLPDLHDFLPRHISATPMDSAFNAASSEQQAAVCQQIIEQTSQYQTDKGIYVPFQMQLVSASK